jgi:MATE family multidrug resistance protein
MLVAAVWQTFDGIQVVAIGALRGAGNTRAPMIATLVAHWLVGLPIGWALCFRFGLGVTGMWIGLSLGLGGAALLLLAVWSRARLSGATLPSALTAA